MSDGYEGISTERAAWIKKIFAQQHWPIWKAFHDIEHRDAELKDQIAERQAMRDQIGTLRTESFYRLRKQHHSHNGFGK